MCAYTMYFGENWSGQNDKKYTEKFRIMDKEKLITLTASQDKWIFSSTWAL